MPTGMRSMRSDSDRSAPSRYSEFSLAAGRSRRGFSVAMIDIDHFGEVNDTYRVSVDGRALPPEDLAELLTKRLLANAPDDDVALLLYQPVG